ncbi:MAG: Elongation factor P [Candidatus Curtissbacteria bacterium GW2011_GWA2_41_24]|uniref:Elongation factor P n=1 Tax=Candidatus Curtissbacteria bacterium GW2011_GWA2_41_24 TaxID=1618411 RepID=A0A0G0VVK3_9BACT|nr:MAG: Elongation factor P [Candidatus Curtissbacteria bacterium GW2011_GWA2_41_24]
MSFLMNTLKWGEVVVRSKLKLRTCQPSYDQFAVDKRLVEDMAKFLKEGMELTLFAVADKPLYIEIPKILEYKVAQTGGSARGNTVGATYKDAVLENGLTVKVPLFIKIGEVVRVDTRIGEYVERAK